MKKIVSSLCALGFLAACATPETKVLPPYQLADGRTYQDVVTIGSNGKGTSPTVTTVTTYALVDGPKGSATEDCNCVLKPVATTSGSQAGIYNVIIPGIAAGATAAVVADALDDDDDTVQTTAAAEPAPVEPPVVDLP